MLRSTTCSKARRSVCSLATSKRIPEDPKDRTAPRARTSSSLDQGSGRTPESGRPEARRWASGRDCREAACRRHRPTDRPVRGLQGRKPLGHFPFDPFDPAQAIQLSQTIDFRLDGAVDPVIEQMAGTPADHRQDTDAGQGEQQSTQKGQAEGRGRQDPPDNSQPAPPDRPATGPGHGFGPTSRR